MAGAGLRDPQRCLGAAAQPPHRKASSISSILAYFKPRNASKSKRNSFDKPHNAFESWPRRDDVARLLGFGAQGDVKSGGFLNAAAFYMARRPEGEPPASGAGIPVRQGSLTGAGDAGPGGGALHDAAGGAPGTS